MDNKKLDSVEHNEERRTKMRDEAAVQQAQADAARRASVLEQDARERTIRETENQELTQQVGLVKEGETREMLLERIRKLRAEMEPKIEDQPIPIPPEQQKRTEMEQQAGREAVARAEQEVERNRELWRKQEEEERARKGSMETMHHPNPAQNEQYPTSKPK
jgi:uncharacterized protein YdiU (UPF0061 family)